MSIINNHFLNRTLGLLLLGPGGCGKDTQAQKLLDHYGEGATHICVSDLVKKKMGKDEGFANFAKTFLDRSRLLPDEIIHSLVMDEVSVLNAKNFQGIVILNGYARSRQQAIWLRSIFKHTNAVLVVEFGVELHEVIKRAKERGRSDDINIRKRFTQYHRDREAILHKLRSQGANVVTLSTGSVNEVHGELITLMRRHLIDTSHHQKELASRADECFKSVDSESDLARQEAS